MKRDDKCIDKMIKTEMKKTAEISNSIVNSFKKIFFDVKNRQKTPDQISKQEDESSSQLIAENSDNILNPKFQLNSENMRQFIIVNFNRFKKENSASLNIKYELKPFLKSCGNILNDEEIDFLLYIIGKGKNSKTGFLQLGQLCSICGTILYFRQKKPQAIAKFVLDNYYSENKKVYRDVEMRWTDVEVFLANYNEYFNKNQIKFIESQCKYIGEYFTTDSLISALFTPSQYYPY